MSDWQGWVIPGVNAGFRTKAAAERHIRETRIRETRMPGVKPIRVKRPEDQIEWSKSLRKNPARKKNPTKAQKREKAKKLSAKRRIAKALQNFVRKANPAAKGVVKATKVKGGWNVRVVDVGRA